MKRFRLTKVSKILIMILVVAALCGAGLFAVKSGFVKSGDTTKENTRVETNVNKNEKNPIKETAQNNKADKEIKNDAAINLSLDEWIG